MVDRLDLTVFDRALAALGRALDLKDDAARVALLGDDGPEVVTSHVIKCFELAYETALKMMTRRLALDRPEAGTNAMSYNDRMRLAADSGLIGDPRSWFRFRDLRNRTVHTYSSDQARAVAAGVSEFMKAAQALFAELDRRNA